MLKNLSNNNISQFYMDCIDKSIQTSIHRFRLLIISGYNTQSKKNKNMYFYFDNEWKKINICKYI